MRVTKDEAVEVLAVNPPIEVAWTSKNGKLRDDDGNEIDERQTVPWVWALGPYGSWPMTVEDALKNISSSDVLAIDESWRIGWTVYWLDWWGCAVVSDALERINERRKA